MDGKEFFEGLQIEADHYFNMNHFKHELNTNRT